MTPACMGGNCLRRQSRGYYHSDNLQPPSERLCEPGKSDAWQPIVDLKPAEVDPKC